MIRGSIVALVTPMTDDGAVDWPALDRLVEWHIASGTQGIVAVGTTGESPTLDMAEHLAVIARVVACVGGRVPVIGGTGANATREAIELTEGAHRAGVDACLLVTPYYNKPTQDGLFQHFRAVARAVPVPQILYNVPGRTACDLSTATAMRLAQVPGIVGVKDATGKIERARELLDTRPAGFALYCGEDALAMRSMLMGYDGVISVTANVVPRQMAEMVSAALAGDAPAAGRYDAPLAALHRDLFVEANPIPVKWALARMGRIGPGIRLPLTALSPPCHAVVLAALAEAGVPGTLSEERIAHA